MPKRPDVLLELALLALRRVPRFLNQRSLSEYLQDELCQSAIERQLEIAGDALSQLRKHDAALFAKIPEGDLVVAFRNVLAHGYATLDHRRVYDCFRPGRRASERPRKAPLGNTGGERRIAHSACAPDALDAHPKWTNERPSNRSACRLRVRNRP